jgi:hypothetical protein
MAGTVRFPCPHKSALVHVMLTMVMHAGWTISVAGLPPGRLVKLRLLRKW